MTLESTVKTEITLPADEVQLRRKPRSCALEPRFYSEAVAVKALARSLADEVSGLRTRQSDTSYFKLTAFLRCLLVNFFAISVADPGRRLAIGLRAESYTKDSEFSYRTVTGAMKGLEALGYVTIAIRGYWDAKRRTGTTTRFEATPKLAAALTTWDLSVIQIEERRPLIELRMSKRDWKAATLPYQNVVRRNKRGRSKGKPALPLPPRVPRNLPWPAKFRVTKARRVANLRRINRTLQHQFQAIHVSDQLLQSVLGRRKKPINLFNSAMHRVFTTDPHKGGRFAAGWWQTTPKDQDSGELRKHIYMSAPGKAPAPTIELDYEAFHVRMLYALCGIECESDPNMLYPDEAKSTAARPTVKVLTLIMINSDSREIATKSAKEKINRELFPKWWAKNHKGSAPWPEMERGRKEDQKLALMRLPPLNELLANIERRHALIAKYFYSGEGRRLMFEDSEIAEGVMLRMMHEHRIVPLPVHDSFIVRHDYADALERIMKKTFVERFAVSIPIKRTQLSQGKNAALDLCELGFVGPNDLYSRLLGVWKNKTST